ncbi:MAG: amidase family protein [Candidatus Woesearchaeota archaeon]
MRFSEYDPLEVVEVAEEVISVCEQYPAYFSFFDASLVRKQAQEVRDRLVSGEEVGCLAGVFVSVKDNLCVEGVSSCANSRILEGYKPFFDATAVRLLRKQGAIILGKTSMDEFGFGSFNVNVGLGRSVPANPVDSSRVTGGSSGGSAALTAVLSSFPHVSLAESTGGSIACPASFCGVLGFTPSYGVVSRHGLISYANSLDKVGVMGLYEEDVSLVMRLLSVQDSSDSTSVVLPKTSSSVSRVGVFRPQGVSEEVLEVFEEFVSSLKKEYEVVEVSFPTTMKFGVSCYYVLAMCEASTNLACLSGLRYGKEGSKRGVSFSEYFSSVRSKHFNEESKRRVMLGTFARMAGYRDAFYERAARVRTLIIDEYKEVFEGVDVFVSPAMPMVAPLFEEVSSLSAAQTYAMDSLLVGPNLAGLPHMSVPLSSKSLPVGALVVGGQLADKQVLSFVEALR